MVEDLTSDLDCLDSSTVFATHAMLVLFRNVKRHSICVRKELNPSITLFRIAE